MTQFEHYNDAQPWAAEARKRRARAQKWENLWSVINRLAFVGFFMWVLISVIVLWEGWPGNLP